jgi:hypothetical protein
MSCAADESMSPLQMDVPMPGEERDREWLERKGRWGLRRLRAPRHRSRPRAAPGSPAAARSPCSSSPVKGTTTWGERGGPAAGVPAPLPQIEKSLQPQGPCTAGGGGTAAWSSSAAPVTRKGLELLRRAVPSSPLRLRSTSHPHPGLAPPSSLLHRSRCRHAARAPLLPWISGCGC